MTSRDPSPVQQQALRQFQACLDSMSAALTAGDAPQIQQQAQCLRVAALVMGQAVAAPAMAADPAARRWLQQMSAALAALRLAVARQSVAVDRRLDVILPPAASATYGRTASSPVPRTSAYTSLRA